MWRRLLCIAILSGFCHGDIKLFSGRAAETHKSVNNWGIDLGASLATCRQKVGWVEVTSSDVLSKYPFDQKLSFLRSKTTVVWSDRTPRSNGFPTYLVAVFADESKSALTDLIEVKDGFKRPLVKGEYERNLRGVRPGIAVVEMYSRIGQESCDYFLDSDGKWRVRFFYSGYGGAFFTIEADAATGILISARETTILMTGALLTLKEPNLTIATLDAQVRLLCEKCQEEDACVHLMLSGNLEESHLCEQCAKDILSPSLLARLRWDSAGEGTEGYVHATVHILRVENDSIIGRVLKSSLYPRGSELAIRLCFVSEEQRRVGVEFTFTCPTMHISEVVIDRDR